MIMEELVVHPAYWRRGHGGNLARWCVDLARIDKKKIGVTANEMGKDLYCKLGFRNLKEIHLDGDESAPQGVSFTVMENKSTARGMGLY
jgi:GNAT superfamily N-acetyltransferase